MSSSARYEESSGRDFIRLVRCHVKVGLVLVYPVRGIKQAGLRPFSTKSHEGRARPRPFGTLNQAGGTSSVRYEVARKESMSSFVGTRYQAGGTTSVRFEFVQEELVHVRPAREIK